MSEQHGKFRKGDRVRFRTGSRMRHNYNIATDEIGSVIEVEPHPPETGPSPRIAVRFPSCSDVLPYAWETEYEPAS